MRQCVREEARQLAVDYLKHCLNPGSQGRPPNRTAETLRKVTDQMVEQHQAAFNSMKSRFDNGLRFSSKPAAEEEEEAAAAAAAFAAGQPAVSSQLQEEKKTSALGATATAVAAGDFLRRVVEEMSADEKMNWGRVVSVFAFAGVLSRHLRDSGIVMCPATGPSPLDSLADSVANYLGKEKREWIEQNGGWEGFLRFFGSNDHWQESTVRNMLITVAGFGIAGLACLLAVR